MKFAILGSGTGSNAEAILKAFRAGELGNAVPVGIFCDIPNAKILEHGKTYGVPAWQLDPGPFKTKFSPERNGQKQFAKRARNGLCSLVLCAC